MSVKSRTLNTVPGAYQVGHPSFFGASCLGVCREGIEYTRVALSPNGMQYVFTSLGIITFDNTIPFNPGEKVFVKYQT